MRGSSEKTFINDYTTGRILPALCKFTLPIFLANLLQTAYHVVDMMVVGRVVGSTGLSGVSVGNDVLAFLTFLSMGFSTASQIIISQYIGADKRDRLARFIGTMSIFLVLCAVSMTVICLCARDLILNLMNTPPEAWGQAAAYTTTCMCGLIFIYGYNIVSAIMRGLGDAKRPFMFIAVAAVVNLLVDLIFVVGFKWEAFGAALATVLAQAVSFLTALIYLYRRRERFGFKFTRKDFRIDKTELLVLIKLGVPFAFRSAAIQFSKLFVNSWINSYGVTISAATGVTHKVDTFANLMGNAVNAAGSSMVGQNIGAGKYNRVSRILGSALCINGVCAALLISLVVLTPKTVFGLFTTEAAVLAACLQYVPLAALNFAFSALRSSFNTFAGGTGNYTYNLAVALLDGIFARVGFSLLFGLALGMGYYGFWLGNAAASSLPFLIGLVYYLSGTWKKKSAILKASE